MTPIDKTLWNIFFAVIGVLMSFYWYAFYKTMGFKKWLSILASAILTIEYAVFGMVLWNYYN